MPYLLGLDIGTSGAKALLCDEQGQVINTATATYPLSQPQPLWSEQEPSDWWQGAQSALQQVVTQVDVAPDQIMGLGLTGQMHGAVFLDKANQVLRPAILWNDQRTAAECVEITEKVGAARLIEIAGNPALTGFQAPKILWLRRHEPDHYAQLAHVLLPKDYVRLLLTGHYATDASDAAGTLLLDLQARDWSDELLQRLDIPREWLPGVYEGPAVTGRLRADVAVSLGIPAGLPVVAGGGDNAAAAVGTGIIRSGAISASIGTSGVVFAHSDTLRFDPAGRLHTFCHAVPQAYHLMGVTLAAGGALRWYRDTVAQGVSYDELTAEAATVPVGAEGLLFLPYLTGERAPHLDPLARGAWIGLTARHTRAHMTRAVLEGITYSLRDSLEIMRALAVPMEFAVAIGGGARSAMWRQMQADVFGLKVVTMQADEGPAYGAALLAGVGVGLFKDVSAACALLREQTEVYPQAETSAQYERYYRMYTRQYEALRVSMHELAGEG